MEDTRAAVAVLIGPTEQVVLGPVERMGECGWALVDDLLRLHVLAGRFGWHLRLVDVATDLRELIDLAGVSDQLVD